MIDLARRSNALERIDTETLAFDAFAECLQDIETINRCTFAYRPTLAWLDQVFDGVKTPQPVTILDVGSGHGDMLRRVAKWAQQRNLAVNLVGVDVNAWSTKAAADATSTDLSISYQTKNVFDLATDLSADVVISSLFTHHLSGADVVKFLRWMNAHTSLGWFVNDLHRHPVPYHVIRAATRILPVSPVVRNDAPLSVARGFKRQEWLALLYRSGVDPARATVKWCFPFRYCVGYRHGSA